jgi:glycosyltransferase involved in cell wall biosynthesis
MDVTVVVPMHNAEATIGQCLDSIAAQTLPPTRILVVDDASTDGSVAVARRSGITGLEVVRLEHNVGPGASRNAGAARAQTEWLAFLDADDRWQPEFLEQVARAIESTGADYASAGGIREFAYRTDRRRSVRVLSGAPGCRDLTDEFWRVALRFMPINCSSAVIRRELFQSAGGFCESVRNGEDISLWAALWLDGRFVFANEALFVSVATAGGLSAGPMPYAAVYEPLRLVGGSLRRAIAQRKKGWTWFLAWFLSAIVRRHATWLVRLVRRSVRRAGPAKAQVES